MGAGEGGGVGAVIEVFSKASSPFCMPLVRQSLKCINKFDPNISCGSRVMSIFTN